jgi:hypothetical protein
MANRIVIGLIALMGAGCTTPPQQQQQPPPSVERKAPDVKPEVLSDHGLLVGVIAARSMSNTAVEQLGFSLAAVDIDGVRYTDAVQGNYLVLPLKPGDYTLQSLHIYRSLDDRTGTRYPLAYKFQIVKGQATNLGAMALVRQEGKDKEGRYWKVRVDNTDDMAAYLQRQHPQVAANLRPAKPVLAGEAKYADGKMIELVRRDIARHSWIFSEDPTLAQYVGDELGTIVKLLRNSQGKIAAFDVLDSGTTTAMLSCSGHDQRFVCSSAEPALYFVEGTSVKRRPLPFQAKHVWVHTFAPRGLVLVDERMTVYSSRDDGATWSKYVWYPRKEPLHHLASIKFANGKNGYYAYSTFTADPLAPQIIYYDHARGTYRAIDTPKTNAFQRLIETPQGLLLGPHNFERKDTRATLYFQSAGRSDWQARTLPGNRCGLLHRADERMSKLNVFCDGKLYESVDAGNAWAERSITTAQK